MIKYSDIEKYLMLDRWKRRGQLHSSTFLKIIPAKKRFSFSTRIASYDVITYHTTQMSAYCKSHTSGRWAYMRDHYNHFGTQLRRQQAQARGIPFDPHSRHWVNFYFDNEDDAMLFRMKFNSDIAPLFP